MQVLQIFLPDKSNTQSKSSINVFIAHLVLVSTHDRGHFTSQMCEWISWIIRAIWNPHVIKSSTNDWLNADGRYGSFDDKVKTLYAANTKVSPSIIRQHAPNPLPC